MYNKALIENIRKDFPGTSAELDGAKVTYLDSAATTLKSQAMIDAINEYYGGISSNVHRGKNYSLELVSNRYENARYRVAELISCSGNEVVFLRNTTEAINLVASGLELTKEDRVLVCSDAHHSNFLPWMEHANVDIVQPNDVGGLDMDHFMDLMKKRPKVVAITHCSNVTAVYNPIEMMISEAKKVGAITVVDAAQSVPHRKINVNELDVDFLTFSAHKLAGPTGVGILYGKQERLKALKPALFGGGMVDWVDNKGYRLRKIPHRFEAGTPNIAGAYGLGASIDYLNKIGFELLESHDRDMGKYMLNKAMERDYLEIINKDPNADRGAVVSFKVPTSPKLDDAARVLSDTYGIMCRNGHMCAQPYVDELADSQILRISAYIYNTEEEIDYFFESLDEISTFLFY